jgi:hypothetical protein
VATFATVGRPVILENGAPPKYVADQVGDRLETMFTNYASVMPRGGKPHANLLRAKPAAEEKARTGENGA